MCVKICFVFDCFVGNSLRRFARIEEFERKLEMQAAHLMNSTLKLFGGTPAQSDKQQLTYEFVSAHC